jgi:phosphoglycolate phosphatase
MRPSYDAVILDFDYTLADSSRGIIECVNYALGALGLPLASAERIRPTIGMSLPDILSQLAGNGEAARGEEFSRLFIERADQIMAGMTVVYPVVPETVATLRAAGLRLAIVTTKLRYRIEAILPPALRREFGLVIGVEDVSRPKPDPEGLLMAVAGLGSVPSRALYVGDSPTDAETARRAHVPFVAVLSGATPESAFADYAPYAILENVAKLPALLLGDRSANQGAPARI